MNIGAEALYANRQGVDTAGHNIANAQTEGYSRQRVNLTQRIPTETRGYLKGNGVYVQNITRAHDKFIEKQLNQALQQSGDSKSRLDALKGVEQIFSPETANSVSEEIGDFFNALQALAASPNETPVRTSVREAATDLTSAFRRVDSNLRRTQSDLDFKVAGTAKEANDLVQEIGKLNVAILTMEAGRSGTANDLRDQQELLVRKLSEKIDINYYRSEHDTLVVRGPNQALLVDGKLTGEILTTKNSETGMFDVVMKDAEGKHTKRITDHILHGELKATLDVRDKVVGGLINRNNELAASVAYHVNSIHRQGYGTGDYKDVTGRDFFTVPADINFAAQHIQISDTVMEDVNAIAAAATPNAPGDNVVVNEIIRLRDQKIMAEGNMTFVEFYSDVIGNLGIEVERVQHKMQSDDVVLGDVNARREAISGVSLDEEAVDLLRWQTAFAASSKVITTTDEMLETVLSLKR